MLTWEMNAPCWKGCKLAGTIDMGVITNGPVSNFYPEIAVLELPFLFSSNEEAYKILDGPIEQEVARQSQ